MSSSNERGWWLDNWFPLLVILFGLIFVSVLVSFKPGDAAPTGSSRISD